MRAWRCASPGDQPALTVEQVPRPVPGAGEVLVEVRAFAPGFPDLLMTRGLYQLKPPPPFTPCAEFAGTVAALGPGVAGRAIGERVMGVVRFGAAAEAVVVPAGECLPLPDNLDFAHGAAYLIAAKTAYVGLVVRGGLAPGETLLVHGAAGGVGLAAVELGKHLGATVIATASSRHKLDVAAARGADHLIDLAAGGFREQVKALTGGRGADVVFDPVGGALFEESLRCIATFGRLLVVGFASGRIPQVAVNQVLIKQVSIVGVRAGEYGRQHPAGGAAVNAALLELARARRLGAHVHARYGFGQLGEVFAEIAGRRAIGRLVIEVPGSPGASCAD
jgi:NADPH2:quinone reductase